MHPVPINQGARTVSQLVESLGITFSLLHRWKAQARKSDEVLEQNIKVNRVTKELKTRDQELNIARTALCIYSHAD